MNEPEAQLVPEVPVVAAPGAGASAEGSLPALKAYLAQLLNRYTAEHPEVIATQKRIARLESEMSASGAPPAAPPPEAPPEEPGVATTNTDILVSDLAAQVAAMDRDIKNLEERHEQIRSQIGVYQSRVEKIPEVEQELQSLERDYDLISRYYSELLNRKLEAETAGAVERKWQEEQFKILDPAQVPQKPEFPKPSFFLAVGTLIGLGAGLAVAFLLEVADPTVKNLRQLEGLLPYPVLLTLPRMKEPRMRFRRRSNSPIPPASPPSEEEDEAALSAAS
jgi:hypothetical protein